MFKWNGDVSKKKKKHQFNSNVRSVFFFKS